MALEFNHAMIYSTKLTEALGFYCDILGFELIERFATAYARLKSPGGSTSIALHAVEAGQEIHPETEGMRLYFEVKELDDFCTALRQRGVHFTQMPKDMPWGWRHAYLRDPDGHEISLYWAGDARFKKTQ